MNTCIFSEVMSSTFQHSNEHDPPKAMKFLRHNSELGRNIPFACRKSIIIQCSCLVPIQEMLSQFLLEIVIFPRYVCEGDIWTQWMTTCPVDRPTTRSAMKVSSVSPERWDTMVPQPFDFARLWALIDSVTDPIWFTFSRRQLQAFLSTAVWILVGFVTVRSSPTICNNSKCCWPLHFPTCLYKQNLACLHIVIGSHMVHSQLPK